MKWDYKVGDTFDYLDEDGIHKVLTVNWVDETTTDPHIQLVRTTANTGAVISADAYYWNEWGKNFKHAVTNALWGMSGPKT